MKYLRLILLLGVYVLLTLITSLGALLYLFRGLRHTDPMNRIWYPWWALLLAGDTTWTAVKRKGNGTV